MDNSTTYKLLQAIYSFDADIEAGAIGVLKKDGNVYFERGKYFWSVELVKKYPLFFQEVIITEEILSCENWEVYQVRSASGKIARKTPLLQGFQGMVTEYSFIWDSESGRSTEAYKEDFILSSKTNRIYAVRHRSNEHKFYMLNDSTEKGVIADITKDNKQIVVVFEKEALAK